MADAELARNSLVGYNAIQRLRAATAAHAAGGTDAPDALGSAGHRTIPLDPLLRPPSPPLPAPAPPAPPLAPQQRIDCPAPDCGRRGVDGFAAQSLLWEHLVAAHGMGQPGR